MLPCGWHVLTVHALTDSLRALTLSAQAGNIPYYGRCRELKSPPPYPASLHAAHVVDIRQRRGHTVPRSNSCREFNNLLVLDSPDEDSHQGVDIILYTDLLWVTL